MTIILWLDLVAFGLLTIFFFESRNAKKAFAEIKQLEEKLLDVNGATSLEELGTNTLVNFAVMYTSSWIGPNTFVYALVLGTLSLCFGISALTGVSVAWAITSPRFTSMILAKVFRGRSSGASED